MGTLNQKLCKQYSGLDPSCYLPFPNPKSRFIHMAKKGPCNKDLRFRVAASSYDTVRRSFWELAELECAYYLI